MQKNITEYTIAPELFERLTDIRIMLTQAVEAHGYADMEDNKRKELAFRGMMHTFIVTADRDMEAIMENVRCSKEAE